MKSQCHENFLTNMTACIQLCLTAVISATWNDLITVSVSN